MPRRSTEPALTALLRRLRSGWSHFFLLLLLLLLTASPRAGSAQDARPFLFADRTSAVGAFSVAVTRAAGEGAVLRGGWFSLHVGRALGLGGAGYDLRGDVRVSLPGEELALSFGYGGLLVELRPFQGTAGPSLRLLAGMGNADLHARASGRERGSDNFLVFEPQAALARSVHRSVGMHVSAGYRRVLGVSGLAPLADGDLSGPTLAVSISIGPL